MFFLNLRLKKLVTAKSHQVCRAKGDALGGKQTWVKCSEESYAHHYTTERSTADPQCKFSIGQGDQMCHFLGRTHALSKAFCSFCGVLVNIFTLYAKGPWFKSRPLAVGICLPL